ncbi:RNA-dependent RNA polymerase 1 [Trichonephila inaurata madagascariensis]|uniref:RNA-dependent RNA polymerase n=1 Tax=Trichonephila inaurata madagascariensis TaxID=2747483 RepID=A0A8X6MM71_9ARAC|nr:RNA-dependent RNA polymerase 1 [Trichonephila inaurata madagascariensis]
MDDGRSVDKFASEAETFFKNCKPEKFTYFFEKGRIKKYADEYIDDCDLYEIAFTIICSNVQKNSDIENFGSTISKNWCDNAKHNQFLQWLLPDRSNSFSANFKDHCGTVKASEFAFGTIPSMKSFVQCYSFCSKGSLSSILCSFSHLQRHFILYISNTHTKNCMHTEEMGHKVKINYDSLLRIIADVDPFKPAAELYLHMEHPPLIYVTHSKKEQTSVIYPDSENLHNQPRRISKAKEMEYGTDKFERTFSLGCACNHTLCESRMRIGKAPVLKLVITDKFQARWLINHLILRRAEKTEICLTAMNTVKIHDSFKELKKFPLFCKSPNNISSYIDQFNCEYAWRVLISKSHFVFHQLKLNSQKNSNCIWNLMKDLSSCASKNPSAVVKTLFYLSSMVDKGIIFTFHTTFLNKFNYFCNFVELNTLPKGMCYVRRVIITPSRVIFLPPYEHFDNRIIRKFGIEYMLRISIQDDNFEKLTYAVQYNSKRDQIMEEVVVKILTNGLSVGSRHYEFLACSSSQLREHGLWMYAPDMNGNTAASIRQWMGDFSPIKNVAKYMARMGQCLSTTEEGVQVCLGSNNEIFLKDIKSRNKKYIFSDGIGCVSESLANEVRVALMKNRGLDESNDTCYQPSAFQIRYKGCKGMVVENPMLPGRVIGIRPSMNKFNCKTSDLLEIVKTSAPRKLFLNKHLITILEQMGIQKETFLNLQSVMMLNLLHSLMNESQATSLLIKTIRVDFPFQDLQEAGISFTNEPFFRSLLLSVFKSLAANLCSSMRIAIPEKYGRNMLAVLDETRTLKYGEVFVQYSVSTTCPNSPLKVLKGPVVVTKNPSLHPGDVRKLTAVDVKALHHIKDCIVFPQQGKRPHPDEMAGSDLDGDECVVLWHEDLIFNENYPPMDYPTYEEKSNLNNIGLNDMVDFFCHYIKNDCIGSFAHAHLMWADKSENGIFSKKCMNIAKQYPYVLDFAKHGTTKYLKKSERPDQYPDFMQKGLSANTYYSKRALGSLYRASRVLDACSSKIDLTEIETVSIDPDLCYPGWELYESSAEKHKLKYIKMISEVLRRYNIYSEAEAFSGFFEFKLFKKWRQEKSDAIKVIISYMRNISQTFKYIFYKEMQQEIKENNLNEKESIVRKYQRASAWYMVVYSKKTKIGMSFPWILSDILVKMKKHANLSKSSKNSFLEDIDSDIELSITSGILKCDLSGPLETCRCRYLSQIVLLEWISKARLNLCSTSACHSCFDRIFSHFLQHSNIYCCSASNSEECKCSEKCSPCEFILKFLEFYVKKVSDNIGKCTEGCDGFISRNLQELSLQTLSYLAISRNIFHLGINYETKNFTKKAFSETNLDGYFEEGYPLKIPVKTDSLKEVIENNREEVIEYLKKNSGVYHIVLQPESDLHDNFYLIVNSSGKTWQRWNLEEILLDPDFTEKLLNALNIESAVQLRI